MPSLSLAGLLQILLYAAVLILPGLLVALAAGLRSWAAAASAPLITYGLTALIGPLSAAGLRWSPLTLAGGAVLLAGLVALLRLVERRRRRTDPDAGVESTPADRSGDLAVAAGVAVGALLGLVTVLIGIGRLDAFPQDWDATFHANAIRFILDTGNADPGALRVINNYEDSTFFYPNAYHALAAVVGMLGGAGLPELLNLQMVLVPGLAGLTLAALLREYGARVALTATAPVLLATFTGFGPDMLWRGPLLPFVTAVALIPGFLLLLRRVLAAPAVATAVLAAVCAVGLLGLHPSVALSAAIFAVPMVLARWAGHPGRIPREALTLVLVGAAAALLGLQFALGALAVGGTGDVVDWPADQSPGQAVGDLFLLNHAVEAPQFWVVALLLVGAVAVRRIRFLWWWLAGAGVFGGLFVVASAYDTQWAETLTRPWWNDAWRFMALACLGLAVVAANGAVVMGDWVLRRVRSVAPLGGRPPRMLLGGAVVVVLAAYGVLSNGFYVPSKGARMQVRFEDGPTVSSSELAGMRVLAELAGPGERIMNDPLDGSAWMYAVHGLQPMYGHVIAPRTFNDIGPDQRALLKRFRCVDTDPVVQALVDEYDITYVFVGSSYVRESFRRVSGLIALADVESLELVYSQGGTRIFRVTTPPPATSASAEQDSCGTTTA
ncbi:hypothetical protein BH18ACT7_BH18ACT7_06610 [soil metagenome]